MTHKRPENKGEVPCLIYGREMKFLTTSHMRANHQADGVTDINSYHDWVANHFDLPEDDPIFEPGELTIPGRFEGHIEKLNK